MPINKKLCLLVLTGSFGASLMACAETTVRESESFVASYRHPRAIALVPFSAHRPEPPNQRLVRPPGFGGYVAVGQIAPEAPETITSLFRSKLASTGYELISQERVVKTVSSVEGLEDKPEALAQKLGQQLKVDSVLMGWVFRYRERIGNEWGVKEPASVAFVALLMSGEDGTVQWRGRFDETQQPLSRDVLRVSSFVRRGGRWVTARELAADGIAQMLLTFPGEKRLGVER
jgi:hypothetical protein